MKPSESAVLEKLQAIPFPGFSRDVVSLGIVRRVDVDGSTVSVAAITPSPAGTIPEDPQASRRTREALTEAVRASVGPMDGVDEVEVRFASGSPTAGLEMVGSGPSAAASGGVDAGLVPGVRAIVAVASGKGGVGKSTVAVNLAITLARSGRRVGLLDADIYGPSVPIMTGIDGQPTLDRATRKLVPFERHGIRVMSLGFLVPKDNAVVWRGPMVMKAIEQLLRDVDWGSLDVLVVDMPPGTGDAQLTLSQRVRLAGAVIVTTPQDVALADATKGVAMFRKVGVPVFGVVENMSYFACPHCAERSDVFGHGGGRAEAERLGVPFLGEIPLDAAIREGGDTGAPIAARGTEDARAGAFDAIAAGVAERLVGDAPPDDPPSHDGWLSRLRRGLGG